MANRKIGDLVATVGTYQDRDTGQEKKRRQKCGVVFKDDERGHVSIKLDALPLSPEWSGYLNIFFDEDRPEQSGGQITYSSPKEVPVAGESGADIPF